MFSPSAKRADDNAFNLHKTLIIVFYSWYNAGDFIILNFAYRNNSVVNS